MRPALPGGVVTWFVTGFAIAISNWHLTEASRIGELAVTPFQFPQPGTLGYLQRRLFFCVLFPVGPDPVTERGLADPEFAGDISDSA